MLDFTDILLNQLRTADSFEEVVQAVHQSDWQELLQSITPEDVERSLARETATPLDFLRFLSPAASDVLEPMAQKAYRLTRQYFGRTISLYIPLYIANYCTNRCVYCGFNADNRVRRRKLTLSEIEEEAAAIARSQIKHILLLTGEAPQVTPVEYLIEAVTILRRYFSSIGIEVFPMSTEDYARLYRAGVDSLTIYQEVYDPDTYHRVHLGGPKKDYRFRLGAPERGASAGFRLVNIGALFGLADVRKEAFLCGLHARYLEDRFLNTEFAVSLPRIVEAEGGYKPPFPLDDRTFVQILLAYRLFLPRVGINISTRERAEFRDQLLPLGVTRFSAGSRTEVGGYAHCQMASTPQFSVHDNRSVEEIVQTLKQKGYQPIFKDWVPV